MVGNTGASDQPDNQAPKPAKPRVKTFHCTNCGASVTVRYPGQSLSVVCESCHSIIDANDPLYKILSKDFGKLGTYKLAIPFGTRGKLKDRTWECIGFMVRTDVASFYSWQEYLLYNPYYGFRWLLEDHGHWSLTTTIKEKPAEGTSGYEYALLNDKRYRLFNRGQAKVDYVLGEFYWRVVVDSRVMMTDYICPPEMLSRERDDNEITWSISEYIPPEQIKEAFKLPSMPALAPYTVAPNQPIAATVAWKKIAKLWLAFMALLTFVQVMHVATASNRNVLSYTHDFAINGKTTDLSTPVFSVNKDVGNVKIVFGAPVNNSWFFVSGELVNTKSGESYPFESTVEYYNGVDSDGAWSEGGTTSDMFISSVPGGEYQLNLDTESGDFKDTSWRQFTVAVINDTPMFANYFWCMFFVSIVPFLAWYNQRTFEVRRWSNSDFSPFPSSSSSSD
jgi:Domain of unknown function (DUF4178)